MKMKIKILDVTFDEVIKSTSISAKTSYGVALESMVPLIDRLDIQRNALRPQFYSKLENDIVKGCIMPPLTLALISEGFRHEKTEATADFVEKNIESAFVLDGIQRLNTLKRVAAELDIDRPIYCNILICDSKDNLLYRMITLNNGQKPMSARHQVEILLDNIYKFDDLDLKIVSEKEQGSKRITGAFKKGDVISAYLAFIGKSVNIDNQKIIESKMDELIVDNIIESNLPERSFEFSDVVNFISNLCENPSLYKWFSVHNNLIGFAAGISETFNTLRNWSVNDFEQFVDGFEEVFAYIDVSKVRLGLARRRAVQYFFSHSEEVKLLSRTKLIEAIADVV